MSGTRKGSPLIVAVLAIAVAGCGGGGGGDGGGGGGGGGALPPSASGWVAGSFLPASTHAGRCVNPRAGTNPSGGTDIQGTVLNENNWLRSWSNDLYLWYNEITDRDPGLYTTTEYFTC